MVASGRQARSAKNRLARSRVSVPLSIAGLQLPPGCPVKAKDLDELVHGESALQQLCALKAIVAAVGIFKGQGKTTADVPGLAEVVMAVLEILPVSGSKALHDEIKVMLQGLPDDMCSNAVDTYLPKLTAINHWEMLLGIGVLCKVECAQKSLHKHLVSILVAAGAALDALSVSLRWNDAKSIRAQVDQVINNSSALEVALLDSLHIHDGVGDAAEPEMPAFVLNAVMDFLNTNSVQVAASVTELVEAKPTLRAAAMLQLTQSLLGLLKNDAVQKDALTPCAIVLCSLISHSHNTAEAVAVQLAVAAGCHGHINLAAYSKHFAESGRRPIISVGDIQGCVLLHHDLYSPFARQALMRAALSSGTQDVLMASLAVADGSQGPSMMLRQSESESEREVGPSLMFSLIYDRIIAQCSATADLFFICYGLQSLAYAIDIAREALERILGDQGQYAHLPKVSIAKVQTMCKEGITLLWPHCEDPFQGIVDQTKAMFDVLISLAELAAKLEAQAKVEAQATGHGEAQETAAPPNLQPHQIPVAPHTPHTPAIQEHYEELVALALGVKPNRKARYRILVALVPRVGVKALLARSPGLASSVLEAMRDQSVGSCAASLLEVLLRTDPSSDWWLAPLLHALTDTDAKLRYGLCNYALPTIARVVPRGIALLLAALQERPDSLPHKTWSEPADDVCVHVSHLWAMTAVIKVARKWGVSSDAPAHQECAQALAPEATMHVLRAALLHEEDEMRLNALEMLCLHPKMTEPPTPGEIAMVQEFLSLNMKSSSSNYRQKCMELLKKFLMRLRISRQHIEALRRKALRGVRNDKQEPFKMPEGSSLRVRQEADDFLEWLCEHLGAALFPGASYERNIMALELFAITIDVWQPARARFPDPQVAELKCSEEDELKIRTVLFRPHTLDAVVNCIVNSFDYVRKQALEVLWRFPAPLPGLEERAAVVKLLAWSESLINSPRARESDAGSLILKVVYCKYVAGLGWYLSPFPTTDPTSEQDAAAAAAAAAGAGAGEVHGAQSTAQHAVPPAVFFLRKLLAGIDRRIDSAEVNLEATFASSFAQGLLLALRQVLPDVQQEMPSLLGTQRQQQTDAHLVTLWQQLLADMLGRMRVLAAIAIRAMAGCPPERVGGDEKGERPLIVGGAAVSTGLFGSMYRKEPQAKVLASLPTPHSVQRDSVAAIHGGIQAMHRNTHPELPKGAALEAHPRHTHVASLDVLAQEGGEEEDCDEAKLARLGPKEQLLVVSCWLTLKEVGLVVGTCVQGTCLDSPKYLSRTQLIAIGNLLLDIIFSTLHNGAIEKARLGFQKVCEKLLRCPRRDVRGLPAEWLERLLERVFAHDVPVVRRSSQLSFSILAILDAEVPNTQRLLLERTMLFLLAVAKGQPPPATVAGGTLAAPADHAPVKPGAAAAAAEVKPEAVGEVRDGGVLLRAQVHALNILRHLFLDTNLAKEVSSYMPEAMVCALDGFGAASWAVRNSSTLAFSVLLSRSMGGAAQRKVFGASEFFLRYPALCPALLTRLARAAEALFARAERGDGEGDGSSSSAPGDMHPDLQPVLVLLAQLAPSLHVRDDQAHLDAFIPLVRRCLSYQNGMVRLMAARSLHPFVPVQAVPAFICNHLLGSLPARYAHPAPRAFADHNQVHGVLEAVRWLVKQNTSRDDSWPHILASLANQEDSSSWHLLYHRFGAYVEWVTDERLPPPIRLVLLRIASDLLWPPGGALVPLTEHALGAAALLRRTTLDTCLLLLHTHDAPSTPAPPPTTPPRAAPDGPMLDALLAQAARLAAREHLRNAGSCALVQAEQVAHVDAALRLTRRHRYEERYMALRAVKESVLGRLALPPLQPPVREHLHAALLLRLGSETHGAGCLRKLMRVLVELGRLPPHLERLGLEVQGVWEHTRRLSSARDPKVREKGLVLSGEVLAALLCRQLRDAGRALAAADALALQRMLGEWLLGVEEQGDESRHVDERAAAVDALCRSGILLLSRGSLHLVSEDGWLLLRPVLVRAWLLALVLLQDDDEETRRFMARAVSAAVLPAQHEQQEEGAGGVYAAGVQPAKAIELAFKHVSGGALGAHEPAWHAFLTNMLSPNTAHPQEQHSGDGDEDERAGCEAGDALHAGDVHGAEAQGAEAVSEGAEAVSDEAEAVSDEAMARRLFEKECDNFQAEEVVMVQLGALHLRRLAHALPAAALLPHSLASRRAVEAAAAVARLETHVATIQGARRASAWAGGLTSRQDLFLLTYRLVLACYAWGVESPEQGLVFRMRKIANDMQAVGAHPLLLHALRLTHGWKEVRDGMEGESLRLMWLVSPTA